MDGIAEVEREMVELLPTGGEGLEGISKEVTPALKSRMVYGLKSPKPTNDTKEKWPGSKDRQTGQTKAPGSFQICKILREKSDLD